MAMSLIEMRDNLAETINRVRFGGERIIIKRHGKNVAALVSVEDLAWMEKLEDELDDRLVLQRRKELKSGKARLIDHAEAQKQLSKAGRKK
jgi:prevent-host-death family protein